MVSTVMQNARCKMQKERISLRRNRLHFEFCILH
jgi:hypothetical protein